MILNLIHNISDLDFFLSQIDELTDEKNYSVPHEWIEENRYLPKELTPKPGFYDYDYTPYMREILDHFSPLSATRKVAVMKGVQLGLTTGVLESIIAYYIGCAPTPMLYISADRDMVKMGMGTKILRLLESTGLQDKIFAQQQTGNKRRTGNTSFEKEYPGGFLHAVGARSGSKLRQMSYPCMLMDELDGFPDTLAKEGDPVALAENRTNAYAEKRKILYISTPLVTQTSKINKLYHKGDQRKYYVPCKHCKEKILLEFHIKGADDEPAGLLYETNDKGVLIYDSVRYRCQLCGQEMKNYDKAYFLNRGEWAATAETQEMGLVSYHINGLYSPPGMYAWENLVYDWLACWDDKTKRIKDIEAYKSFVNTKLGMPWEERGEAPKFEKIISHRRAIYSRGEIPNRAAEKEAGGPIVIVTAGADVHKKSINIEITGWCENGISYSIDYRVIDGDVGNISGVHSPWEKLASMIENEVFTADDGQQYRISQTFIDARYATDTVYRFCDNYTAGVLPIVGRRSITGGGAVREYKPKIGGLGINVNTNFFKDRLMAWFRKDWNDGEPQPLGFPNFPQDYGDDYFRELSSEEKMAEKSRKTGQLIGYNWIKVKAAQGNHALDCRVYSMASLEYFAYKFCTATLNNIDYRNDMEYDDYIEFVDSEGAINSLVWPLFWKYYKLFYREGS